MRFEQSIHWTDGQFLQPHHFQYMQRVAAEYNRFNRHFSLPYAWGLINFELDLEALDAARVAVRRFSAIMSDGLELSEPGNCILKPLDLSDALKKNPGALTVYVAAPFWSELEANLADEAAPEEKKLYLTGKKRIRDENTGDNEITLITRRLNARFVTDQEDLRDMQILPVLKLIVTQRSESEFSVKPDERFIPPFMLLTADSAVFNSASSLLADVRRCRDKILNTLTAIKFGPEKFTGPDGWNMAQLRVLNYYETRLSALLVSGHISPFDLHLELASFLAELMSLKPMNGIREIKKYIHEDCAPQFTELFNDIRSFIMEDGGIEYIRRDFSPIEGGNYLFCPLETGDILRMDEVYIAFHAAAPDDVMIQALELGDTFKLINPASKTMRIRGLKLTGTRYPPRFLPVLSDTLWFKPELAGSPRVWLEICEEKGIMIDYARNMFPDLKVTLFITLKERA
ncbi:MAG: type VI secretion system baseplate subunit TssK [Treponema sp.]|jgi:type VI secretion system ImpJ/VasE family protein|nr:type VI secretion system baseplate subunit TssK [Treponema sp.]